MMFFIASASRARVARSYRQGRLLGRVCYLCRVFQHVGGGSHDRFRKLNTCSGRIACGGEGLPSSEERIAAKD